MAEMFQRDHHGCLSSEWMLFRTISAADKCDYNATILITGEARVLIAPGEVL